MSSGKNKVEEKKGSVQKGGSSGEHAGGSNRAQAEVQPGAIGKFKEYLDESVVELKKVSTPTRAQTTQATLVTVVILSFVALCLFLLDQIYIQLRLGLF